jgi:hypothetical protein
MLAKSKMCPIRWWSSPPRVLLAVGTMGVVPLGSISVGGKGSKPLIAPFSNPGGLAGRPLMGSSPVFMQRCLAC